MRLYVGDKLLEFGDSDLDCMYISEGKEGTVYRYENDALKIYKENQEKCRLDEEDSIKLSQIETERVLLPRKIIYDEDYITFMGYTTPFIEKSTIEDIVDMDIMQFVDELDAVNSDLKKLSDNGVLVDDFDMINLLYNGQIFFGDPGSYVFVDSFPTKIYRSNVYQLSQFVKEELFGMLDLSLEEKTMIDVNFDKYKYIGSQIRNNAVPGETVSQYVKRIAR